MLWKPLRKLAISHAFDNTDWDCFPQQSHMFMKGNSAKLYRSVYLCQATEAVKNYLNKSNGIQFLCTCFCSQL